MVRIHFIDPAVSKVFARRALEHVPRVGDELRFGENRFFKVRRVVWCYDESEPNNERANIEIEPC